MIRRPTSMKLRIPILRKKTIKSINNFFIPCNTVSTTVSEQNIAKCCKELNIPINSKQDTVRRAFLELAKKYHPDSGCPEASVDKFCAIENAFRVLSKHNTGNSNTEEVESIVFDIRHTAPQHRQYLSFEGIGHGTPSQRMKQWAQVKAQRAADNVMEHRVNKAVAAENTLMKKSKYFKKHDIKTKYGFDRLVEDLIQESISKGEFENLHGSGKPLKDQNSNPYVDFTTHKLNEVLINNGFTPEWITMNKDIDEEIEAFKETIRAARADLGPCPLSDEDEAKWKETCERYSQVAKCINNKINTFNLIVPLINKQKFQIKYEEICGDILQKGKCIHDLPKCIREGRQNRAASVSAESDDFLSVFFKTVGDFFADLTKFNSNETKKG